MTYEIYSFEQALTDLLVEESDIGTICKNSGINESKFREYISDKVFICEHCNLYCLEEDRADPIEDPVYGDIDSNWCWECAKLES